MTSILKTLSSGIGAFALTLVLAACAVPGPPMGATEIRQGVIEQITPISIPSTHHTGVGAVVGGLAGLGIGSLIGGGTGRDVAMVLGAVGGGLAGNEIQKKYDQPTAGQQIIVRMHSGVLVSVVQAANYGLRPGQRVYVQGYGEGAQVTPQ